MEIIKKTTECAFNIDTPDNICIDDNLIKKLHTFAKKNKNITTNNPRDSIKQLQSAYRTRHPNIDPAAVLLMFMETRDFYA